MSPSSTVHIDLVGRSWHWVKGIEELLGSGYAHICAQQGADDLRRVRRAGTTAGLEQTKLVAGWFGPVGAKRRAVHEGVRGWARPWGKQ